MVISGHLVHCFGLICLADSTPGIKWSTLSFYKRNTFLCLQANLRWLFKLIAINTVSTSLWLFFVATVENCSGMDSIEAFLVRPFSHKYNQYKRKVARNGQRPTKQDFILASASNLMQGKCCVDYKWKKLLLTLRDLRNKLKLNRLIHWLCASFWIPMQIGLKGFFYCQLKLMQTDLLKGFAWIWCVLSNWESLLGSNLPILNLATVKARKILFLSSIL